MEVFNIEMVQISFKSIHIKIHFFFFKSSGLGY